MHNYLTPRALGSPCFKELFMRPSVSPSTQKRQRAEQMPGCGNRCHGSRAGGYRRERVVTTIRSERENRRNGTDSNSKRTKRKSQHAGGEDRSPGAEDGKGVKLDRTSQSGRWIGFGSTGWTCISDHEKEGLHSLIQLERRVFFSCVGDSLHSDELGAIQL